MDTLCKSYPTKFVTKSLSGIHKAADRVVDETPFGKEYWKRKFKIFVKGNKTHC